MMPDGSCKGDSDPDPDPPKPDPPKPDPGKGCKTYYQELRCFKPKHPDPFVYNLMLKISNLAFNDVPHLEFAISEIDNLDIALRNASNLDQIKVSSILPHFESEQHQKLRNLDEKEKFPSSCTEIEKPTVVYKFNKLKLYPRFSKDCKSDIIKFLGDSSRSGKFLGMKLMISMPLNGDIGHIKLAPTVQEYYMDKKSIASIFKYTNQKVIDVQYNSIYSSPKELVKWDGESLGNKVRDISDFGDVLLILMWFFIAIGSHSILGILVSLSVLFHVVKKFKYLNTNYGPYMKHLLQVLESKGKIVPLKDFQVKNYWYNYRNSRINTLLSPGPYQPYSFWLVRGKLIKLALIFFIRFFRKKVLFKIFKKWEK
jgi:hypothetical protein